MTQTDIEFVPHVHKGEKPSAVIVDMDGTLAIRGNRGPFDWASVGEDLPNPPVIMLVKALINDGHNIVIVTGRPDVCRIPTKMWLDMYLDYGLPLHMRKTGDYRPDYIVKYEIFREHIEEKHNVLFCIDDRNSTVDLWRNKLKIPTFQVADGDF